jgi:hypothetical protein
VLEGVIKLESEKAKWSNGSKFGSPFITADDKDGAINDGKDKERFVLPLSTKFCLVSSTWRSSAHERAADPSPNAPNVEHRFQGSMHATTCRTPTKVQTRTWRSLVPESSHPKPLDTWTLDT